MGDSAMFTLFEILMHAMGMLVIFIIGHTWIEMVKAVEKEAETKLQLSVGFCILIGFTVGLQSGFYFLPGRDLLFYAGEFGFAVSPIVWWVCRRGGSTTTTDPTE